MSSNQNELNQIFTALNALDLNNRKAAEDHLLKKDLTPQFISQIFNYIKDYDYSNLENKTQAALYIKNAIISELDLHDFNKRDEDRRVILNEVNQMRVKDEVLKVIFTISSELSKHLVSLVVALAHHRFTKTWVGLLESIKFHMSVQSSVYQQKMSIEILRRIFRNHRNQIETPSIAEDVVNTLQTIASPLKALFEHYMEVLFNEFKLQESANAGNIFNALKIIANSLDLIHSLNSVDLPEQFQDNIGAWMDLISHTLDIPFVCLNEKSLDEAQKCQKRTLGIFNLYAGKYFDDFKQYIRPFFDKIWTLVLSKQMNQIPQRLLTQAIMSVDILIRSPEFKHELGQNLHQIFQFLILPALKFTSDDRDQFDQEPDEWLKYDLLLHNEDTQRQQAMKLSSSIARAFPSETQIILGQMQQVFMDPFSKNPQQEWKSFADFINVILATVVSRSVIANNNAKYLFDMGKVQIIYSSLLQDLLNPKLNYTDYPILRATQLKVIVQMKEVPSIDWILKIFQSLCGFLKCDHPVLQSYASVCLQTLLTLPEKSVDNSQFLSAQEKVTFFVKEEHIKQHYIVLLEALAYTIEQDSNNIHALRSLYRVLRVAKTSSFEVLKQMPQFLAKQLAGVKLQPISAEYNYVLCETIAYIFKLIISTAKESKTPQEQQQLLNIYILYLNQLRPIFIEVIEQDCLEIIGYIFQIQGYLLNEQAPETPLPNHSQYVQMLLQQDDYFSSEHTQLIPAFMKYLIASLRRTPEIFYDMQEKIVKCLFAALIKFHFDDSGFAFFAEYIIAFANNNSMSMDLLLTLLMKLFARQTYQRQKLGTVPLKFSRGMTKVLSLCFLKHGVLGFRDTWDKKQKSLFDMVLKRYGEMLPCLDSPINKKIGVVAFTSVINELFSVYQVKADKSNFIKAEEVFKNIFKGLVLLLKSFERMNENIILITDDMFVLEKYKVISFEGNRYQPIYCAQLSDIDPTEIENQFEYYLEGMKNLQSQLKSANISLRQYVEVWMPDDLEFLSMDSVRERFNLWDE